MKTINGSILKAMLISGCNNLNNRKKEVDALNVFPVPDGDTGTNMSLTFTNGISEVNKSGSEQLPVIAKTLSRGLLMGARGNSGVILSQIFRGFYQSVGDQTELDIKAFSDAMINGSVLAYKAVMRPVEGTILTVVRESTTAAQKYYEENPECEFNEYMDILCKEAKASLDNTPELLPVLKEARVVDSGGSGLLTIFEGFRAYLEGNPIQEGSTVSKGDSPDKSFGYRTEFILQLSEQGKHLFKEERVRNSLSKVGDNPTIIIDGDIVKVRMNTMMPGEILNQGQRYGEFKKVQIDNLSEEVSPSILEENTPVNSEKKTYGIISVAAGDGLEKLFKEYRVDIVVSGGQTMNPSTEDIVEAINKINAEHVFVLPNNGNIIMAAQQAAQVIEDKHVIVLETKSIPQGLAACLSFNPEADFETNQQVMVDAIKNVKTGQVTYAIKDTSVEGVAIKKGDYMGIFEKDIVISCQDKMEATKKLRDRMIDEDSEIVTIIQGEDSTVEEINALQEYVEETHEIDVDVAFGNQPVYSFIISVE